MQKGFVKLWRKTLDSGLLQSPTTLQVFIWILLNASHSERKTCVRETFVDLKKGDVVVSRKLIASQLNITEKQAFTAIEKLKKLKIVDSRATNRFTVISLINWDTYQGIGTAESTAEGTAEVQQRDSRSTTEGQQKDSRGTAEGQHYNKERINNYENGEKERKEEKKASVRTRGAAAAYSEEFEAFWAVYPRKEGKGKAWESWQKLKALIPDDVCERVQRAARCDQWQRDNGQYIPHPTTWLNQRRWDDEMCQKPKSTLAPWQIRENEMEAMIQQLVFKKFPDIDYFYMTDEQTDYCMELRDLSYEELLELCSAA